MPCPHDESVGIPLIVYDPRHPGQAGKESDMPVCGEDFCPTILGYAKAENEIDFVGLDLSGMIRGLSPETSHEGVLLEYRHSKNHTNLPSWFGFRNRTHTGISTDSNEAVVSYNLF